MDYGSLSLHDLPDHEAEALLDDAYRAAHPRCERCRARLCDDPTCGCGRPEPVRAEEDASLLYCSESCRDLHGVDGGQSR